MFKIKIIRKISFVVFLMFCFTNILYPFNDTKANDSKTITIIFKTNPTAATVTKTSLKYNKDFAFSFAMDDGYKDAYENGYKYMFGGTSSLRSETYSGQYFTDGSGRSIAESSQPFLGDFTWFSYDSSNFIDLHTNDGLNNFTWNNLADAYQNGFSIINHGWTSNGYPNPIDTIFNYPAPHGSSALDYNYEVTQGNATLVSHGFPLPSIFSAPSGDQNYIDPAFNNGAKIVTNEASNYTYTGGTVSVPSDGVLVSSNFNLNSNFISRYFYSDNKFTPVTSTSVNDYVDSIATKSRGTDKYWANGFTHRIGIDTGGSLSWNNFTTLMNHISNTYGRNGDDSVWVAPAQEVYEYLAVKQNTIISQHLVDNTLILTLDTSFVPVSLRNYALSLKVNSDAEIASISYGSGEFTKNSENLNTGLINLEWGTNHNNNDFTRVESKVMTAESTRSQADINIATTYTNLLPSSPEKNSFINRIENISPLGKRWLFGLGASNATATNINGLWWNNIILEPSSDTIQTATGIVDVENIASSLEFVLPVPASDANKFTKNTWGNNTNTSYPASKQIDGYSIYYPTGAEGKIEIKNLNINKKYQVVVLGSLDEVHNDISKSKAFYAVQGLIQGPMDAYNNVNNTLTFNSVSPTAEGVITVTTYPEISSWGRAAINIIDLREQTDSKPVVVFNSSVLRNSTNGPVDIDYKLSDDNNSLVSVSDYEYSSTGLFDGEQHAATPLVSDGTHSGISNLTSSPSGINHRFVWDAKSDLNGQEGIYYFRLKPSNGIVDGAYAQSSSILIDFKTPTVSNINTTTGVTNTDITWQTNENTRSKVDYGLTINYDLNIGNLNSGFYIKNKKGSLSDLQSCSTYHYKISSVDPSGNEVVSDDQFFHTGGCPNPVASPTVGTYSSSQSIALSATGSTYIKYSISSMPESCSVGTLYSSTISVSTTTTIYALACDNSGNSSTASFVYTITDNNGGGNNGPTSYMKYSTTATPVDCFNGELYSDSLIFSSSTKLYMRVCNVSDNSSVSTFEYITPKSSIATTSTSSGSSGGGSSRYYPPVVSNPVVVLAPVVSTVPSVFVPTISSIQKVKKNLELGMKNKDVKTLQLFLISQNKGQYANKLSVNGATTYFGKLTKQALAEWQKANKVYPANGYLGSKTRTKIKKLGL